MATIIVVYCLVASSAKGEDILIRVLGIGLIVGSMSLSANADGTDKAADMELLKTQLAGYVQVAVGWHLDKECSFLANPAKSEFERNVALNTVGLNKKIESLVGDKMKAFGIVAGAQKQAKKYAEGKYQSCDEEAKEVVIGAVINARTLAQQHQAELSKQGQ